MALWKIDLNVHIISFLVKCLQNQIKYKQLKDTF